MNAELFAMLGWPEIMGIGIVVLILFGAKKVPELMKGLGHGIKEFKKATRDVQDDLQRALEEEPPAPPRRREHTIAHTGESPETTAPDPASTPSAGDRPRD